MINPVDQGNYKVEDLRRYYWKGEEGVGSMMKMGDGDDEKERRAAHQGVA